MLPDAASEWRAAAEADAELGKRAPGGEFPEGARGAACAQKTHLLGRVEKRGLITLDPRTMLGMLAAAALIAFMQKSLACEIALLVAFSVLLALMGRWRMAVGFAAGFAGLWVMLNMVMPNVNVLSTFAFSFTLARKIFFCLMTATLLVSECSVHRLMAAFSKLRVPDAVLIPLTVTMRYFPTLKDEASHIRDALRLRDIAPAARVECFVVPLVVSATNTADELSRAATCRGIENPARTTDTERLRMGVADWVVLACAVCAVAAVALVGGAY